MLGCKIFSLSERALCHPTILNYLDPPKYKETRAQTIRTSALKALVCELNKLTSFELNKRSWKIILIKPIARVAYSSLVIFPASLLDILICGTLAVFSLGRYKILKLSGDIKAADTEWKKIERYAAVTDYAVHVAFFTGLGLFFMGGGMRLISMALRSKNISDKIGGLVHVATWIPMGSLLIGAWGYEHLIPENKKLPYDLRNELGFVSKDGSLLECSAQDAVKFERVSENGETFIQFKGWAKDTYVSLISRAEAELLNCVIEVKTYLGNENKEPLTYCYPFEGKTVSTHLQSQFPQEVGDASNEKFLQIDTFVKKLNFLDQKIAVLKKLYASAKAEAKVSPEKVSCYLKEEDYRECFDNAHSFILPISKGQEWEEKLQALKLPDEEEIPRSSSEEKPLYDQFKDFAKISKKSVKNQEEPYSYREMLGLSEECSKEEYKKALREHQLVLHPDKNKDREVEATELFQLHSFIKDALDLEFP